MINLIFSTYGQFLAGSRDHPQKVMIDLGIKYKKSVPQSISDNWWFFDCDIPEVVELPEYIEVRDFGDLSHFVGWGLSEDDVKSLTERL